MRNAALRGATGQAGLISGLTLLLGSLLSAAVTEELAGQKDDQSRLEVLHRAVVAVPAWLSAPFGAFRRSTNLSISHLALPDVRAEFDAEGNDVVFFFGKASNPAEPFLSSEFIEDSSTRVAMEKVRDDLAELHAAFHRPEEPPKPVSVVIDLDYPLPGLDFVLELES
jgi:hypothetical protein